MHFQRILALALAALLIGCGSENKADHAAAFDLLQKNVDAMQREDVAGVMATVHPESPDFEATRGVIEELFSKFDLKYELSDLKVVSATPAEIKVSFVQKTMKVSGPPELPNHIVEGVHTLRKEGAQWKLFRTVTIRTTPI